VIIPSGQTLDVSAGTVTPSAGQIVQFVYDTDNTSGGFATSSTAYVTSAGKLPSLSITPKFSNSLIHIHYTVGMQHDGSGQIENTIYRAISGGTTTDLSGGNTYGLSFKGTTNQSWTETSINWVDTPSTTNAVTYTWYSRAEVAVSVSPNHGGCSWTAVLMEIKQ